MKYYDRKINYYETDQMGIVHHYRKPVEMHYSFGDDPEIIASVHPCRTDIEVVSVECCRILEQVKSCRYTETGITVAHAWQDYEVSGISASDLIHFYSSGSYSDWQTA